MAIAIFEYAQAEQMKSKVKNSRSTMAAKALHGLNETSDEDKEGSICREHVRKA